MMYSWLVLPFIVSTALAGDGFERLNLAMSVSPTGRSFAVQDGDGAVWLTDVVAGKRSLLSARGQETARLSWSSDDQHLLMTRNGTAVVLDRTGRRRTSFSPAAQAAISPNGQHVSFVRDHQLWLASADGSSAHQIAGGGNLLAGEPDAVYAREFGVNTHVWWAPDSASLAFIETEYREPDRYVRPGTKLPMFRLKTVDVLSGRTRTLAESDREWTYLLRVAWSGDSHRIVYYRMNRTQNRAELQILDPRESSADCPRTILTEKDDYWVNAPETPLFTRDGSQLVVSSERSGNRHVYVYNLEGGLIRDLTPPDLEVSRLHRAADAEGNVYVSGSTGDRQQQHMYRLPLWGGVARQVTTAAGWHEVMLSATGTVFLDSYSSASTPPVVVWHGQRGSVPQGSPSRQKPTANEFFHIETHDQARLAARLFKPDDFDASKKYPVILYAFAGPQGRVVQDAWSGWQMAWNRHMVSQGYLVLAVDVRGSAGYGHGFEQPIHYQFGAQEIADLREVVSFLRRQSYVDPARLGIWGSAYYGGYTAVQAMLAFPGGFKAGFADSPITDWREYNAYFTERYLGLPQSRVTEYDASSPLGNSRRLTGTLLVASGANHLLHVEKLRKAMGAVKNPDVAKRFQVLRLADGYRDGNHAELAKLMATLTQFFKDTL